MWYGQIKKKKIFFQGECINSSVAGKRRIAEWGAMHTESSQHTLPGVATVVIAVCAVAATLFITVLMVLQVCMLILSYWCCNIKWAHNTCCCHYSHNSVCLYRFVILSCARGHQGLYFHDHWAKWAPYPR